MLQLLKIEWLKVKYYTTFWVLLGLTVISITGANYIYFNAISRRSQNMQANAIADAVLGSPFQFPDVWHTVSYVASWLLFIPALIIMITFTNEFTYKTHRQNIIDGISRTEFISVKMVEVLLVALFCTFIVFITALLFGFIDGTAYFSTEKLEYVFYYFVQVLNYTSVALLLSLLLKRVGIVIAIFFVYTFIFEKIIANLLIFKVGDVGYFLPLKATDTLIPLPILHGVLQKQMPTPATMYLLLTAAVYLIIYAVVCKSKFEKSNL